MNGVDGVILVVIQITDDPSAERTAPLRSTYVRLGRRLLLLDPARGKDRLMEIQQHDGVVVEAAGSRQGFAKHQRERDVSRREREAPGTWVR